MDTMYGLNKENNKKKRCKNNAFSYFCFLIILRLHRPRGRVESCA